MFECFRLFAPTVPAKISSTLLETFMQLAANHVSAAHCKNHADVGQKFKFTSNIKMENILDFCVLYHGMVVGFRWFQRLV